MGAGSSRFSMTAPMGSATVGLDELRRTIRQLVELVELIRRDGLKLQEALGERLDAGGIVKLAPLRAQRGDGVALAPHLAANLGEALGLHRGIEFDAINVGRGEDESADHDEIESAQDHGRPRMTSASEGSRGNIVPIAASRGAASVRSAARSFAERARGLAAISASSAVSGRRVRTLKVGGAAVSSG